MINANLGFRINKYKRRPKKTCRFCIADGVAVALRYTHSLFNSFRCEDDLPFITRSAVVSCSFSTLPNDKFNWIKDLAYWISLQHNYTNVTFADYDPPRKYDVLNQSDFPFNIPLILVYVTCWNPSDHTHINWRRPLATDRWRSDSRHHLQRRQCIE